MKKTTKPATPGQQKPNPQSDTADGESAVLAMIAAMPEPDQESIRILTLSETGAGTIARTSGCQRERSHQVLSRLGYQQGSE
jgi:hypothetical protein